MSFQKHYDQKIIVVHFRSHRKAARQFMTNIARRFPRRAVRLPTLRSAPRHQRRIVKLFMKRSAKKCHRTSAEMSR